MVSKKFAPILKACAPTSHPYLAVKQLVKGGWVSLPAVQQAQRMFSGDSRLFYFSHLLSCYLVHPSSSTFSVWWTPTLTASIRSASPSVVSRVSEDDLPPFLARSPKWTSTEEPETSPRRRSTRLATSSPNPQVSKPPSSHLVLEC